MAGKIGQLLLSSVASSSNISSAIPTSSTTILLQRICQRVLSTSVPGDNPLRLPQEAPSHAANDNAATQPPSTSASPLHNLQETLKNIAEPSTSVDSMDKTIKSLAKTAKPVARKRTWFWYDAHDEKEWQKRELQRQYTDAGYVNMQHVPQSVKKMDRILRLIRGLSFLEASKQLAVFPHKAARYAQQALDRAADDAESKGMKELNLVVDTIYATKGPSYKKMAFKGKGRLTVHRSRTCHIQVVLREVPVAYKGFKANTVPTISYRPPMLIQPRASPALLGAAMSAEHEQQQQQLGVSSGVSQESGAQQSSSLPTSQPAEKQGTVALPSTRTLPASGSSPALHDKGVPGTVKFYEPRPFIVTPAGKKLSRKRQL